MKFTALRATGSTAAVLSCLMFSGGIANADALIDNSGDKSVNVISVENKCNAYTSNQTWIDMINNNPQDAHSGNVGVKDNDDVGSVSSGNASNSSNTNFSSVVTNSGSQACTTTTTQPSGGNGGGNGGGTTTTTASTPVSGGRGGGEATVSVNEVAQVTVPSGGVGAGAGSQSYLAGLVALVTASGAWTVARLRKQFKLVA